MLVGMASIGWMPPSEQADQDANELLSALFRRDADALLIWFARRKFDPEAAMDLMAETFAEVFDRKRLVGDREDDARRWLYGIAHHQLSRFIRRAGPRRRCS